MSKHKKNTHFIEVGAKFQKQRDTIARYLALWIPVLGISQWEIDVAYHAQPPDTFSQGQVGRAKVSWSYRTVELDFFVAGLSESSDERLEYVVVHELCHVLVNEMRDVNHFDDKNMEHEERVVTELAYALIRARHWTKSKGKS